MDIEVLGDYLYIATGQEKPLVRYNPKTDETMEVDFDNGGKNIIKLDKYDNKIYFIGSKEYGLYGINRSGEIKKEMDFDKINETSDIKIEGNQNFHIDETGLYFIDKFNNRVLK